MDQLSELIDRWEQLKQQQDLPAVALGELDAMVDRALEVVARLLGDVTTRLAIERSRHEALRPGF